MKNVRQQVKKSMMWLTAVVIMAAGIFNATGVAADRTADQNSVNVTVNILPPYSPYYSDYSGVNASKVLLTLQNLTNTQLSIKLVGGLKGNNGISITTYSNYTPLQPIILNPHEVKQLNGLALKEIFDINNLSVIGVDKNQLARTSRVPEGIYQFCLRAVSYNNSKNYLSPESAGCSFITIKYPEPPVLIGPAPFSQVAETTPNAIPFNWINPGTVPIGTQYTIQIAPMPDIAKDPNQVLNATSLPMLSKTVSSLGYFYGPAELALTPGKKYAWRVIATDPTHKVEFENKGVSAAAIFVYGNSSLNPVLAGNPASPANLLNIIIPDCKTTPSPTLVVGPHSNLNLNWLWHEQIDSLTMFGLIDSNILQHYTKLQTKDGPVTIRGYGVSLEKVSNAFPNKNSPANVIFGTYAPEQKLSLTEQEVFAKGLVLGEDYVMKVRAYNSAGVIITTATSCPFKLRSELHIGKPKLNVSGRVAYAFDKTVYKGANRASISMQLVDYADTKFMPYVYHIGEDQAQVSFDDTREIVSATTDDDGNFKAQFTQLAADTGHKYLMVRVNTPYYKNPEQNIPVIIPALSVNSTGGNVTYKQDSLKIGDVKTDVYTYDLTVSVQRGFGGGLTDQQWKDYYGVNPSDIFGSRLIDTLSINPKAKIPAGMAVNLYRKEKAYDIPMFEGDSAATAKAVTEREFNNRRDNDHRARTMRVAQGITKIVYDANKNPKTIVVFKNLICNLEAGDQYYMRAQLTDADTLVNNNNEATAPEQRFSFNPYITNWKNTHYIATADYHIISKKPPTARVKGKVMYQWPSTPGVLHPYANQHIKVTMHSDGVAGDYADQTISAGNCQFYPAVLVESVQSPNGWTYQRPVPQLPDGVVATGVTDANGNFDIEVLDLTRMGKINVTLHQTDGQPHGETCDETQKKIQDAAIANAKADAHTGSAAVVNGYTSQTMLDYLATIKEKVKNNGGGDDGELDFGAGAGTDFGTGMPSSSLHGTNAADLLNNHGNGTGGNPGFGGGANPVNFGLNGHGVPNLGSYGAGAAAGGAQYQNMMHFQQDSPFGPAMPGQMPDNNLTLDRYFMLEGIPDLVSQNKNAVNQPSHFVVQPFETVDLGTIITNVPELRDFPVNIYASNQTDSHALAGAKVVVIRSPYAKTLDPKFDGEGSVKHPEQKLLSPGFAKTASYQGASSTYGYNSAIGYYINGYQQYSYKQDGTFEWVIDHPLEVSNASGNKVTVNLGNMRLYGDLSQYALQISPNPEGTGGSFAPLIVSLPVINSQGDYDGYVTHDAFFSNNQFGKQVIATDNNIGGSKFQEYDIHGIYVTLSPSRIAGRVYDANTSKGLKSAMVTITINNQVHNIATLDTSGYFEVINGQGVYWGDNTKVNITAAATGYSAINSGYNKTVAASGDNAYTTVGLLPSAQLFGKIVDENGLEVDAYIQDNDGSIFTSSDLKSGLPIVSKVQHNLKIMPKDVGYFETVVNITPKDGYNSLPNTIVYRRKHRMDFHIIASDGSNLPDNSIQVIINNDQKLSAMVVGNHARISFENVSVYNYSVQVIDTKNFGFIPKIFNIKNEESEKMMPYDIALDKGATVTGHVTMNNQPVANARVYMDYSEDKGIFSVASQNDKAKLEARTNADGAYIISGIPVANGDQVKIHATFDAAYTVNGGLASVTINDNSAIANFALTKFDGPVINNVFGFPLSVEKIEKIDNSRSKVTGIVDLSSNNSSFTWLNTDSKIRVSEVVFTQQQVNGIATMVPETASVSLDGIASLKMKYQEKYNVLLTKPASGVAAAQSKSAAGAFNTSNMPTSSLKIEKDGNGGAVMAKASITDNSFNFPSSYLDFTDSVTNQPIPFYLSTPVANSITNKTTIKALYNNGKSAGSSSGGARATQLIAPEYYLSNADGNALAFKFINFNTTASPSSSYIDNTGKIHLDVTVLGNIPNSSPGDVSVHIKNLVLDGNAIQASKGNDPIIVNLQTWQLQVNDWSIDPKKGGIYSENSLVKTGIVDIPAKLFNLRKDLFVLKNFDVNNISLGGGLVNLSGINSDNAHLVYDEACGSDHKAHWRFSAVSLTNAPVATIPLPYVEGKSPASNLNVDYFQLVSYNNENIVNLSPGQAGMQMFDNNRFTFLPQSISSSANAFTINGQATFDLPRSPQIGMNLLYQKKFNKTDVTPGAFKLNFEGKGYVQFTNDEARPITREGLLTKIHGTVVEPNKINPIPCDLLFGSNDPGVIRLEKDFKVNLDGDGPALPDNLSVSVSDAVTNGMKVDDTKDWTTLKFAGPLNDPKSGAMVGEKPTYKFEVLGDVTAGADGIKMNQINTPLGDVDMSYDFASKTMHGALHMNEVAFGTGKFTGDVQMTFSPKGMLLLGAGSLNTGTLLVDGFGVFNIGVLFGNTPLNGDNIKTVTQYSKAGENQCWLKDNSANFKGFFIGGGYDILNEHYGYDIGIASVSFNARLGVELSVGANFANNNFMALLGAHGDVDAGLSAITGTSISGGVSAHLTAMASYAPAGFAVDGNAGIKINYQICQYIPFAGTSCFGGSKGAKMVFHYGPGATKFKFSLDNNGGAVTCDLSANK